MHQVVYRHHCFRTLHPHQLFLSRKRLGLFSNVPWSLFLFVSFPVVFSSFLFVAPSTSLTLCLLLAVSLLFFCNLFMPQITIVQIVHFVWLICISDWCFWWVNFHSASFVLFHVDIDFFSVSCWCRAESKDLGVFFCIWPFSCVTLPSTPITVNRCICFVHRLSIASPSLDPPVFLVLVPKMLYTEFFSGNGWYPLWIMTLKLGGICACYLFIYLFMLLLLFWEIWTEKCLRLPPLGSNWVMTSANISTKTCHPNTAPPSTSETIHSSDLQVWIFSWPTFPLNILEHIGMLCQ